ncbi:MAG TPA: hypothetical protein VKD08_11335 [Ignavibacteriaceae bacterium]|jgi:hypothetical protein|nr:hypothetical protein [Ignavibacteriaceae bacterium]
MFSAYLNIFRLFVGAIFVILINLSVMAQEKNYFYTNKPYGSESLFNPVSLFINGSFDVTQLQMVSNRIGDQEYGKTFRIVMRSLGHPFENISHYGWNLFLRTEFLPISFKKQEMQWIPNYQQHLIGGGMLYTAMREWYSLHHYPVPWLLSSVTLMTHHILNEMLESGPNEVWSVDEVSDIYIFDLGGIVLFSFDSINEFFSKTLNLSDWSLQATITFPNGRVNAGQYFSMKWKLPFSDTYSLFYRYGMGGVAGLSKKLESGDNLSFGVGFRSKHLVDVTQKARQRTIETSWQAGVYYDRNNSLLASITLSGVKEYFASIDIYPGIVNIGNFSPGLWTVIGRNGDSVFGITSQYVLSFGYEMNY